MDKSQVAKILKKANDLQKGKEIGLAREFISLDDKISTVSENINTKFDTLSEELKKKLEIESVYEVDEQKIVNSVLSQVEIPIPKDGKDYVLTENDKKEIAKFIKVPIVEKIVTQETIIKEQPIVTNEIKEVAVTDTAEVIVEKINELPIDEDIYKIDFSHIKNVPDFSNKTPNGRGWRNLYQLHDVSISEPTNAQVLKYNSTTNLWENGIDTTGVAWGGITGTLSNQTDLQTALNAKADKTFAIAMALALG